MSDLATANRPWPAHVNPLSWAGGVLDAVGVFRLRVRKRGGYEPYGSVVQAKVSRFVAEALTTVLRTGEYKKGYWYVPADDQAEALLAITKYLREPSQVDAAFLVYKYRATKPFTSSKRGEPITDAVKRYRRRLVAPSGEHKRTRSERAKMRARGLTLGGQKAKE